MLSLNKALKKYFHKPKITTLAGILLIVISLALLITIELFKNPEFQSWYIKYQDSLEMLENRVATMGNKWIVVISILILFALKAVLPIPILPISCVCVISGMVFNTVTSVLINVLGCTSLFSIKYLIGFKHKGLTNRILKSYDSIWKILEHDGKGNPWLLFCCRLIPMFPINTVSSIYGNLKYEYKKYLVISTIGFLPKLISYSYIGRNVYNPFSTAFIMPIIILLFLSGTGLLVTNNIIALAKKKGENNG